MNIVGDYLLKNMSLTFDYDGSLKTMSENLNYPPNLERKFIMPKYVVLI